MNKYLFSASIGCLAHVTCLAAAAITCPMELPGRNLTLANVPQGWTAVAPTKILLSSIDVTLGSPEERRVMKSERYGEKKSGSYQIRFSNLNTITQFEKWVTCSYSDNDIAIARRLTQGVSQCVVTYTPDDQGTRSIQAVCK